MPGPNYPQGNIPDGQPDFGKAVKIGSVARTALPAAEAAGDRIPILLDQFGRVIVTSMGGGAIQVEGNVAHDALDGTSNPVKTGSRANAGLPAAVSENDRVNDTATLFGQKRVTPSGVRLSDSVAVDAVIDTVANIDALLAGFDNVQAVHDPQVSNIAGRIGATTGAAVITDSDGTLQQYLRGLVRELIKAARRVGFTTSSNQAVGAASATTFAVVAGDIVNVAVTTEMTMLFGGVDPTATTGKILSAGSSEDFEVPTGQTQLRLFSTAAGRASVTKVSP